MKRTFIIRCVIIAVLIIAIIVGVSAYFIYQNGKKYEIEEVKQYNYFSLRKDNLFGVIDRSGNIIIEPTYDDVKIPNPEKPVFVCYEGDSTKVLNERKEEILTDYDKVEPIQLQNTVNDLIYEKSVLKYQQDGKYGLIDFEGKRITKPIYDSIDSLNYKEGQLLVKQDGKTGVINIKGNTLIDIKYDQINVDGYYTKENGYNYSGYIVSTTTDQGYRYGYINYDGKLLLEPNYNQLSRVTQIQDNNNAYIICAENGRYGVMKNDESIIPNEYQSIDYDEGNNLFTIEKSKKYGIANIDGNIIVPTEYNQIDITGVYLYATNEQGVVVYNSDGTQANIDTNIAIINTSNEKYKIRIDNSNGTKYGVIDKEGQQVIDEKYNYIEYLFDDYFIASTENSKLGIIDDKDNVKVEINNDLLQKIEGTDIIQTMTASDNVTRLYDKSLNKICEMANANIEVKDNYIKISNTEETKYFSKEGKELRNTEVYPNNTLFAKNENGKWGFAKKNGDTVVEAKYDRVTEFNEYGFAGVELDGKWGVLNSKGEEILAPTYVFNDETEPYFIGQYYQVKYALGGVYYTDLNNNE